MRKNLIVRIFATTFCRMTLNTARRFAYPFAPTFSRGLGVPLADVTWLVALAQSTGIICLFSGPLTDRLGYRLMMGIGLGFMAAGMLAGGFFPYYLIFCVALLSASAGKFIFDPALQAYVGVHVPYDRRGRVIGILELSWAGSTLIGIPVIGLLIQKWGWRAPFFSLGLLGGLALLVILRLLPQEKAESTSPFRWNDLQHAWRRILRNHAAIVALGFGFLISTANDMLFVVYGAWLEKDFNLSVVAIGVGTGVIGVAEFCGETLTAVFADRFGLKKSVYAGVLLSGLSYAGLIFLQSRISFALIGLFLIFLTFEFAMVSFLTLCTELMPAYRASMMSGFLATAGLGRVLGALLGIPVWQFGGIVAVGLFAAGINLSALVLFSWGLRNWHR